MPFDTCGGGPVYTQIDGFSEGGGRGGELYFPQVNLLDEITSRGYGSNATYLLTFRNMDDWYRSITHWRGGPGDPLPPMSDRMARADINVSGTSLENFADFVCDHVTRVREAVPEGRLVEVDIDDADAGRMLSDVFDVDRGCWKQANANARLHRRRENDDDDGDDDDGDGDDGGDRNATTGSGSGLGSGSSGSSGSGGTEEKIGGRSTSSTTPPPLPTTTPSPRVVAAANEKVADTYPGKATIRGANGTMRANPTFVVGDRVGVGVGGGGKRGWGGGGGKKAAAPKKEEAGGANKKKKKEESRRQEAMEVAEMMEAGEKSLI